MKTKNKPQNGTIIFRDSTESGFLRLRNAIVNDSRLSFKALGLLSWLLSRPKDWDYTVSGIQAVRQEGKDAITSALR